jgi:hypothetical protein
MALACPAGQELFSSGHTPAAARDSGGAFGAPVARPRLCRCRAAARQLLPARGPASSPRRPRAGAAAAAAPRGVAGGVAWAPPGGLDASLVTPAQQLQGAGPWARPTAQPPQPQPAGGGLAGRAAAPPIGASGPPGCGLAPFQTPASSAPGGAAAGATPSPWPPSSGLSPGPGDAWGWGFGHLASQPTSALPSSAASEGQGGAVAGPQPPSLVTPAPGGRPVSPPALPHKAGVSGEGEGSACVACACREGAWERRPNHAGWARPGGSCGLRKPEGDLGSSAPPACACRHARTRGLSSSFISNSNHMKGLYERIV